MHKTLNFLQRMNKGRRQEPSDCNESLWLPARYRRPFGARMALNAGFSESLSRACFGR
jgi:hypothetical protein